MIQGEEKRQKHRLLHRQCICANTTLLQGLLCRHGDGLSATCVEREQKESCHWLRTECGTGWRKELAADKMAMMQRTSVMY